MRNNERTTGPDRRRSTGRRDLLVIAGWAVVVFFFGMTTDLFARFDARLDEASSGVSGGLWGLLFLLMMSAGIFAVLRWRQAQRETVLRKETEERFRALVEHVPSVTYTWDPNAPAGQSATLYVSPQIERMLGVSPKEWLEDAEAWIECLHPEDRDRVLDASRASDRDGTPFHQEYRAIARDGRELWIRDESAPVTLDPDGRPVRMQGVMYDITQERATQDRLRTAEERYRSLVEQLPAITYVEEPSTGRNIYISPQVEAVYGYDPREWNEDVNLWRRRLHPEDRDRVEAAERAAGASDRFSVDYRSYARDDRVVWVHNEAVLVRDAAGAPLFWQGLVFDITERKLAEGRLRVAEERYRTLVEQMPVVVYIDAVDEFSTASYVSPQYERLTGYSAEHRMSDPELWNAMLHPLDRERVLAESERTNATGDPFDVEYRIVRADGEVVWLHDHAFLVDGPDGVPAWQGVLTDVTERRRAEDALARRDRILEAAGYAAERFLKAQSWTDCIDDVLAHLGAAGEAGQASVYRNVADDEDPDATAAVLEHGWVDPMQLRAANATDVEHLRYTADGFSRWEATLGSGGAIHGPVSDYPQTERSLLEPRGIHSCIVAPVTVEGTWWGFVAFGHAEERLWQTAEIDALRVVANTLGGAIGRERSAARLSEAEARYRGLIEAIPAATYIDTADVVSQAIYMSPQVEQIYGYTPQEWREQPELWEQGLHPDDHDEVVARAERHIREGVPYEAEYRFRHRDGRWIWCHDESVMILDDHGRPVISQGVVFDITQAKQHEEQLREAEERFRAIVEHVPSAIYLDRADASMESLYISPQIEQMTGVTPQEWLATPDLWLTMIDPEEREGVRMTYLKAASAQRPWSAEYRMQTRDGRTIWVRDETTFLHDETGAPSFMQGVLSDITERKLAEQALRESEHRERDAAERLRALDEMKNTFLAAVSHELRSPLTSILGLSLTLERTPEMEPEVHDDLLVRLSANARKLDRLLKDLLDIDRLNRGIVEPQYRRVDVAALAHRTIESLESLAERPMTVEAESVLLMADPAKLERIIENLLMNAARHTTPDRRIWLRVRALDGGALLSVEDEGPGVPAELREVIFEPFRQGPTASPHAPGTGIGLSLVARFAELHGGRAWVEERDGGGASFRVFIPDRNGAGPSAHVPAPALDAAG